MEKAKEIELLRSLKGDTYFGEHFGSDDIEQMCENIKNDFPIEMGCHFAEKEHSLIIKCKRECGYALNDDELEFLIRTADRHINPENYQTPKNQ